MLVLELAQTIIQSWRQHLRTQYSNNWWARHGPLCLAGTPHERADQLAAADWDKAMSPGL